MSSDAAPFCVAPQTWQGGLARYPVNQMHLWNNNAILRTENVDLDVFDATCALEERFKQNGISEADFETLQLTFSLLMVDQSRYDLIPNGREIRVTKGNAVEFFERAHAAFDQLPEAPLLNQPSNGTPPSRLRAATARMRLTEQDREDLNWIRWAATNDPRRLTFYPDEILRWAVMPLSREFMIRLQPEGEKVVVEPDHLTVYLDMVAVVLNEIDRAISIFGYYPPNCVVAAPAEEPKEHFIRNAQPAQTARVPLPPQRVNSHRRSGLNRSAMALAAAAAASGEPSRRPVHRASSAELEQQRALFSPTHDTGGLLAPFQELNL